MKKIEIMLAKAFLFIVLIIIGIVSVSGEEHSVNVIGQQSSKIYWVPKEHTLPDGIVDALMNETHISFRLAVNGVVVPATMFKLNFYGKEINLISIEARDVENIGFADTINNFIVINKYNLRKSYDLTVLLLNNCFLQKEICSINNFCEAIIMQELWHLFNKGINPEKGEYFSEYPSLESKAKNFYLAMKFIENVSQNGPVLPGDSYKYLRVAYKKTFEIEQPINDISKMAIKFTSLLKNNKFDQLINKYKSLAPK